MSILAVGMHGKKAINADAELMGSTTDYSMREASARLAQWISRTDIVAALLGRACRRARGSSRRHSHVVVWPPSFGVRRASAGPLRHAHREAPLVYPSVELRRRRKADDVAGVR